MTTCFDPAILHAEDINRQLCIRRGDGTVIPYLNGCFTLPTGSGSGVDLHVSGVAFAPATGVLTLTLSDASTITTTIPLDADVTTTGHTISNDVLTVSFSDGTTQNVNLSSIFSCAKVLACFGARTGITIALNAGTGLIDFTVTGGSGPTYPTITSPSDRFVFGGTPAAPTPC